MSNDQTLGLLSREAILRLLDEALQSAPAGEAAVAVAVFDIDHFRSLNVDYGEEFAEQLVQRVGEVLVRTYSANSAIGRHTTDEFLIISTGETAARAATLAESARKEVESLVLRPLNAQENAFVHATVSAGVAMYPSDANTRAQLLHKAAEALQRAKQTGKNQVCLASDIEMVPKTVRIPKGQVVRLAELVAQTGHPEMMLVREALDDLFCKYSRQG